MRVIAWDTWAFVEVAEDAPRRSEVEALLDDADVIVTSREVIAETFTFIARRRRSSKLALDWWDSVRESSIRVVDPPFDALRASVDARALGTLSFADVSLARVAREEGARDVATEDAEFRRFGLTPLFAR